MSEAQQKTAADGSYQKVREFLAAQDIARVGIVDDGFDAPDEQDVKGAWKTFVQLAESKPKLWKAMTALDLDPDGDEEHDVISSLEATIQQGGGDLARELQKRMKHHSPASKQAKTGVKNLTQLLETRLSLDLVKLGTDAENKAHDLVEAQIVFLDYYLGTEDAAGVSNAVAVVRKVCAECDKGNKPRPMFVLFSSKDLQKTEFNTLRRRAKIPAWQFRFIRKENLKRDLDIVLKVWELAQGMKPVRGIQQYLDGFKRALDKGFVSLKKTMDDLDLSDVAYMHLMKLNDERASPSHYFTWLFGAFLQNELLRDNIFDNAQRALDDVDFSSVPTRHSEPSQQVLDLYRYVLYEEPRPKFGQDDDGTKSPRLQLGEIYVRTNDGTREALLVLNNSCDLTRPESSLGVMMLRGVVIERRKSSNLNSPKKARSDAFVDGTRHCVLDWALDGSESLSHSEVFKWLKKKKFRLAARMRMENALSLKQLYFSQAERIGLPSSPPMHAELRVAGAFWPDADKKAQELLGAGVTGSTEVFALETHNDKGAKSERIAFTSEFLSRLGEAIGEKVKAKPADEGLKALQKWCTNYTLFTMLLQPRKQNSMNPVGINLGGELRAGKAVGKEFEKFALIICLERPA